MSEMEIQRKFFEEKTGGMFDTLAAAKKACKWPYVWRVWLQDGKIVGKCTLYAYGEVAERTALEDVYPARRGIPTEVLETEILKTFNSFEGVKSNPFTSVKIVRKQKPSRAK